MQCENCLADIQKKKRKYREKLVFALICFELIFMLIVMACNLCWSKIIKNISNILPVKPEQWFGTDDKYLTLGQTKCSNYKPRQHGRVCITKPGLLWKD